MGISSFYGLQTSLRGLLAQQRLLDTTGHNIANASTPGYSRQEAVLAASPALMVPAGATSTGAGAMLGSGVDAENYREIENRAVDPAPSRSPGKIRAAGIAWSSRTPAGVRVIDEESAWSSCEGCDRRDLGGAVVFRPIRPIVSHPISHLNDGLADAGVKARGRAKVKMLPRSTPSSASASAGKR